MRVGSNADAAAARPAAPPAPPAIDPSAVDVMVVDDSLAVRDVLREELSALGFSVRTFDAGEACLAALSDGAKADVVLIDWRMPGMNGIDAAAQIVKRGPDRGAPIVLLMTAVDDTPVKNATKGLPIAAYIAKPINTSTLIEQVTQAIARRRRLEMADRNREAPPVRPAAAASEPLPASVRSPAHGSGDNAGLMPHVRDARILIVEDNRINQQVATEMLRQIGVQSDIAENGQIALDILDAHAADHYDLVLMDIQMPVMDGITATRAIRKNPTFADLPIVALTAHAIGEARDRCFEAGMDEHIVKPVGVQQLTDILNTWIGGSPVAERAAKTAEPGGGKISVDADAGGGDAPVFDPERLESLAELSDGFLEQMLRDFRDRYVDSAKQISAYLADDDYDQAQSLAHTVKGTSGSLGAKRLFVTAEALDHALRERANAAELHGFAEEFAGALARTIEAIERDYGANA